MPALAHLADAHAAAEGRRHLDRLPTPGAAAGGMATVELGREAALVPAGVEMLGAAGVVQKDVKLRAGKRQPGMAALLAAADPAKKEEMDRQLAVAGSLKSGQAPTLHAIQRRFRDQARSAMAQGGDVEAVKTGKMDRPEERFDGVPVLWAPKAVNGYSRPMHDRIAELEKLLLLAERQRKLAEEALEHARDDVAKREAEVEELKRELREFATLGVDERITRLIERAEQGIVTRNEQIAVLEDKVKEMAAQYVAMREEYADKISQLEIALGGSAQTVAKHRREVQLAMAKQGALNAGIKYLLPRFDDIAYDVLVTNYSSMQDAMRRVLTALNRVLGPNCATMIFAPCGLDPNVPRPWDYATVVAGASPFWRQEKPQGRQTRAGPEGKLAVRISAARAQMLEGTDDDDTMVATAHEGVDFLYQCFDREEIGRANRTEAIESDVAALCKWGLGLLEDEALPPTGCVSRFLAIPCSFQEESASNRTIRAVLIAAVYEAPTADNLAYQAGDEIRVPACELAADVIARLLHEEVERRRHAAAGTAAVDPALEAQLERKLRLTAMEAAPAPADGPASRGQTPRSHRSTSTSDGEDETITEFDATQFADLLSRAAQSRMRIAEVLKMMDDMPAAISEMRTYRNPPPGVVETLIASMVISDYFMYKAYRAVGDEYDEREFRADRSQGPIEQTSSLVYARKWSLLNAEVGKKKRRACFEGAWSQIRKTGALQTRKLIDALREAAKSKVRLKLGSAACFLVKDYTEERVAASSWMAGILYSFVENMGQLMIINRQVKRMETLKDKLEGHSEIHVESLHTVSESEVDKAEAANAMQEGSAAAAIYDAAQSHERAVSINPADVLVSGSTSSAFKKKSKKTQLQLA